MITASIVAFHTKHDELKRLLDCALTGYIDRLFIIDNSSNDELRDFVKDNDKVSYIHSLIRDMVRGIMWLSGNP